jgi:methyl-accepting chemotaxis protein
MAVRFNLRAKVLAITLIILAVSQVTGTLLVIASFERDYTDTMQARFRVLGRNLNQSIGEFLSLGVSLEQFVGMGKLLTDLVESNPEISYIIIADTKGAVLYQENPGGVKLPSAFPSAAGPNSSSQRRAGSGRAASQVIRGHYNTLVPILDENDQHVGDIHLGFPAAIVSEKVRGMVGGSFIVTSVSLLVASGLLVLFISLGVARPVSRVVGAMEDIIEGRDLTKRVSVSSSDEVGELAKRFNDFVGSIEGVVKQLSAAPNTISASADELRRALTENSSNVDVVSKTIESLSVGVDRDMDRIVKLVGKIAEISRCAEVVADSARTARSRIQEALNAVSQGASSLSEPSAGYADLPETWDLTGLFNLTGELGREVENIRGQVERLSADSSPSAAGVSGGITPASEEASRAIERCREISSTIDDLYGHIKASVSEFTMDRSIGIVKIREIKWAKGDLAKTSQMARELNSKLPALLMDVEERASALSRESRRMIEDMDEVIETIIEDYNGVRSISTAIADEQKALSEVPPALESFRSRFEKLRDETKGFKIGSV